MSTFLPYTSLFLFYCCCCWWCFARMQPFHCECFVYFPFSSLTQAHFNLFLDNYCLEFTVSYPLNLVMLAHNQQHNNKNKTSNNLPNKRLFSQSVRQTSNNTHTYISGLDKNEISFIFCIVFFCVLVYLLLSLTFEHPK